MKPFDLSSHRSCEIPLVLEGVKPACIVEGVHEAIDPAELFADWAGLLEYKLADSLVFRGRRFQTYSLTLPGGAHAYFDKSGRRQTWRGLGFPACCEDAYRKGKTDSRQNHADCDFWNKGISFFVACKPTCEAAIATVTAWRNVIEQAGYGFTD